MVTKHTKEHIEYILSKKDIETAVRFWLAYTEKATLCFKWDLSEESRVLQVIKLEDK